MTKCARIKDKKESKSIPYKKKSKNTLSNFHFGQNQYVIRISVWMFLGYLSMASYMDKSGIIRENVYDREEKPAYTCSSQRVVISASYTHI